MSVPNRISIITLGVADLARSTGFYESLGWERSPASMPSITFFEMQGSVLGLYERSALADDARVPAEGSGFRGVTTKRILPPARRRPWPEGSPLFWPCPTRHLP